jgi:hypothetical protein
MKNIAETKGNTAQSTPHTISILHVLFDELAVSDRGIMLSQLLVLSIAVHVMCASALRQPLFN